MPDQLVVSIFADEAKADSAVETLEGGAAHFSAIRMGAVGVLVLDEKGNLKEHKFGKSHGGKGAGIGLVLAAVAPPTLLVGAVGGGIAGHFYKKGLGLSAEDRERIGAELAGGKAAVGVIVDGDRASVMEDVLNSLGGVTEAHSLDQTLMDEAAATQSPPTE
jgi:hypothetical protein